MQNQEYITTSAALTILKCSRAYFYKAFIDQLTLYKDENNFRNYFNKEEVKQLAKTKKERKAKIPKNIKIVRNAETNID